MSLRENDGRVIAQSREINYTGYDLENQRACSKDDRRATKKQQQYYQSVSEPNVYTKTMMSQPNWRGFLQKYKSFYDVEVH